MIRLVNFTINNNKSLLFFNWLNTMSKIMIILIKGKFISTVSYMLTAVIL